jgi:hypothetical protein
MQIASETLSTNVELSDSVFSFFSPANSYKEGHHQRGQLAYLEVYLGSKVGALGGDLPLSSCLMAALGEFRLFSVDMKR